MSGRSHSPCRSGSVTIISHRRSCVPPRQKGTHLELELVALVSQLMVDVEVVGLEVVIRAVVGGLKRPHHLARQRQVVDERLASEVPGHIAVALVVGVVEPVSVRMLVVVILNLVAVVVALAMVLVRVPADLDPALDSMGQMTEGRQEGCEVGVRLGTVIRGDVVPEERPSECCRAALDLETLLLAAAKAKEAALLPTLGHMGLIHKHMACDAVGATVVLGAASGIDSRREEKSGYKAGGDDGLHGEDECWKWQ
jgi:hypothetical protein